MRNASRFFILVSLGFISFNAPAQVDSFTVSADSVCQDSCITFINASTSTFHGSTVDSILWFIKGMSIYYPHSDTINVCFPSAGNDSVVLYVYRHSFYRAYSIDTVTKNVTILDCGLGTHNLSTHLLTVYPNPASTNLTITASYNISTISISDLIGKPVQSHDYNAEKVQIDVADLPAGVYLIRINGSEVRKFIKE